MISVLFFGSLCASDPSGKMSNPSWGEPMPSILQDARIASRKLRNNPGLTLIGIVTLALAIGATVAMFSIVEAVLLRPLPFRDPSRLAALREVVPQIGDSYDGSITAKDVLTFSRDLNSFESSGGYIQTHVELSGRGEPTRLMGARMTASMFPTLGVNPLLGRTFTTAEDEQGAKVVVLAYSTWIKMFHGDRDILGKAVDIDRVPHTVVGVMPREFEFPLVPGRMNQTTLWIPMTFSEEERTNPANNWDFGFVGRLKPDATIQSAQADANRISTQIVAAYPAFMKQLTMTAKLTSLKEDAVKNSAPLVRLLFLAVLVVLLIACTNLAGLLLVRTIRRRHEIAVQMALGARSGALLRQSIVEALLISASGGALGLALAGFGLNTWVNMLPETLPRIGDISLNWTVASFALAMVLATGFLCGLVPAFAAMHVNVSDGLKEGGRSGVSKSHLRLRSALVVTEIATALVLLTGAGLLIRSFEKMRAVDPGFRPDHLITARYSLPDREYRTQLQIDTFNQELLSKLKSLPGAESASLSTGLPMFDPAGSSVIYADGAGRASDELNIHSFIDVEGDYFKTTGTSLLRGRTFSEADDAHAPLVAVINRSMAEHYWPGQDPIGKRFKLGTQSLNTPWVSVVGMVADTKQGARDSKNMFQIYHPSKQVLASFGPLMKPGDTVDNTMRIAMRTTADPWLMATTVRNAVWSLDPQLAVADVQTMEDTIAEADAPRRFNTMLITGFALGAVLLAVLGIYVVVAFSVTQRTREMAIRIALGAQRTDVTGMVLQSGLRLGVIGCGFGLIGALAGTRLLKSMLFGVSAFDPLAFFLAVLAILALSMLASFLPARRAAAVEPMTALRFE